MVFLKTTNQSLSISDPLTVLSWCLDRWNFTWKQPSWHFFRNGNLTDWSDLHKSYVNAAVYFSNIGCRFIIVMKWEGWCQICFQMQYQINILIYKLSTHDFVQLACSLPLKMQRISSAFNVFNFTHRVFYFKTLGNIWI